MLPAMAASISIRKGTPTAMIKAYSICCSSAISPGPSVRIMAAFAIRPRIGVRMPVPIEPEKVDSTSVPPAMMNQVLTS